MGKKVMCVNWNIQKKKKPVQLNFLDKAKPFRSTLALINIPPYYA